jgi:hypothetical protein
MYNEKHGASTTSGAEPVSGEVVPLESPGGSETQAFVAKASRSYEFVPPAKFPWDLALLFGGLATAIGAPGIWAAWRVGSIVGWW